MHARTAVLLFGALVLSAALSPLPAQARAPVGYLLMCLNQPQECAGGGAASVAATGTVMSTLRRVNLEVNRSIRPRGDRRGDTWTANATVGDCEEYALAKRRQLIGAGIAPSALRIAYVRTRGGEGHAVLVVKTDRGDLVLDNLTSAIKPLGRSGLRLVSMASADPLKWS